jgi:hypothetical protein
VAEKIPKPFLLVGKGFFHGLMITVTPGVLAPTAALGARIVPNKFSEKAHAG